MSEHAEPDHTDNSDQSKANGLLRLFVRHPNAANLLMVLMLIAGVFAVQNLNTQFFPNFVVDRITVNINWPGASAEDAEANILAAVEPQLRFLNDVKRLDSTAREGGAAITIEYDSGTNLKDAEAEIETALDSVTTLPEDSEDPEITIPRAFDRVATIVVHGPFPESTIRTFAKRIRDDLLNRGVDNIELAGLRDQEVHIDIDQSTLRQLDMTIDDVSTVVRNNTRDLPSGDLEGLVDKQLRTIGETAEISNLRKLEVRALETGDRITIGDIGTVRPSYDIDQTRALINGNPAISLTINRAVNSDTLAQSKIVDDYLAEVSSSFPKSLIITADSGRTDALKARIQLLLKNGIGGLLLVVIVLFIFLNARVAFWVTAGIPVAIAATLGVMLLVGASINMVSLFALLMMLGIIVDDAIVVGEHTATRLSMGDNSFVAAERGAGRMMLPVFAASLTTAAAFAPILLIGDVVGQIMGAIPIVVICTLIASLIECFLILPGHLGHSLQSHKKRLWSPWRQFLISLLIVAFAFSAQNANGPEISTLISTAISSDISFASASEIYASWFGAESWVSFVKADSNPLAHLLVAFIELVQLCLAPLFATIQLLFSWIGSAASYLLSLFLGGLGFVVGQSIAISQWVVSLVSASLIPVALGLFGFFAGLLIESIFYLMALNRNRRPEGQESWFRRLFDRGFGAFRDRPFDWAIRTSFRWRYVTIAICLAAMMVFAVGLIRSGKIGFSFFPSPEAETITANIVFNAGIPRPEALKILADLEQTAYGLENKIGDGEKFIDSVLITYGQSGVNRGQNVADIKVDLTVSEIRSVRTPLIVKTWRESVPTIAGLKSFSISQRRGGAPGRDIDIQLQGATPDILKQSANEITQLIAVIPGVSGAADNLPFGKPEIILELNDRGRTLGLSIDAVGQQVRSAFEGAIPRLLAEGDEEITLRVKQKMEAQGTASLRNFPIRTPANNFVPLGEIVEINESQGFAVIQRKDGKLTVSVTADIDDNLTTTQEVIDELEENGSVRAITSKYGITYRYDGKDKERADAFADLKVGVAIALAFIYIILAWIFGSYTMPLAVMMIIPFGVVGAVVGHFVLGFKLTILSFVGMLGLSGILVNDSLILVSRFQERRAEGESIYDAAIGASRDRLRAVLLTSLSTIGGLTPLMFETSRQAQFLLPMVITIVFGLAFATILVLFMVPALLGIGADIKWFFRSIFYGDSEQIDQLTNQTAQTPVENRLAKPAKTQALEGPAQ